MKIKNFKWNGFGFPVIFDELPATKIRGDLVPDVDWIVVGKIVAAFICTQQEFPFSGNQVKFLRHALSMTVREFAKFIGVKHPSVLRWEAKENLPAKVEAHIEIVLRLKVLRAFDVKLRGLQEAFSHVEDIEKLRAGTYKKFAPVRVPEALVHF